MSGFHIPRPIAWLLDKLDRKTSPAECPMKHCVREDCRNGRCTQAIVDRLNARARNARVRDIDEDSEG